MSGVKKFALVGESFYDGCNECKCAGENMAYCQEMACLDKCYYQNWELDYGHTTPRDMLYVFDKEERCPKLCECLPGGDGVAAVIDCGGRMYYRHSTS